MAAPTAIAPAPPPAAVSAVQATHAPPVSVPSLSAPPSAVPPALDDRLPLFTTHEATVDKVDGRNALVFSVPARSSVLLRLAAPRSHAYEERDLRWLNVLQDIAVVPSRQVDTIAQLAAQALELLRSPKHKPHLEQALRGLVSVLSKEDAALSFSQKALLALRLKEQAARFVREWVQDPVEGFVLRKDHVVGGMRLDDVVATPVGAGYLRGYRRDDGCCIVVFPWGHGFIARRDVAPLQVAIDLERKKRRHNEYLALEHQHLFEQVESLLETHEPEGGASGENDQGSIDWEQYQKLLDELQQEVDPQGVPQHDLSFVRRLQELTQKIRKRQRGAQADSADEEEADGVMKEETVESPIKREGVETAELMDLEEAEEAEEAEEHKESEHQGGDASKKEEEEDDPMEEGE